MSTQKGPEKKAEEQPEGENDWFFDIIINFLRSPRWKTPIMSFLDEYCIIFDSEDENKLEYTPIHHNFKKLVEELIGELLAELSVEQDVFMAACSKAATNPIHKKIVDQIVAVDNFVAFKRLMCKRNAELNQQAMKLIEKQANKAKAEKDEEEKKEEVKVAKEKNSESMIEEQTKTLKDGKELQDKAMQEALKVAQEAERLEEEEFMRKAIEESSKLEEVEKKKYEEEAEEEMKMIQQAIEMSQKEEEVRQEKESVETKQVEEQIKASNFEPPKQEPILEIKPIAEVKAFAPVKLQAPVITPAKAPVEEVKIEELMPPVLQPEFKEPVTKELVDIVASGMSEAEKQKLEQLKKLKEANKLKKKQTKKDNDLGLPKLTADALPALQMNRRGTFEMIPDFLQNKKEVMKDLVKVDEDAMNKAFDKQDQDNKDGLSMSELMALKRAEKEKQLEAAKAAQGTGPTQSEKEDRKARLLAQRDLLRKQKEQKRQEELQTFKQKTETKEDLFSELKKMDDDLKTGGGAKPKANDDEAQRRLTMFRKARQDIAEESKVENEQNYQKRLTEMEQKDKKKKNEVNLEDGDDWLKGLKTTKADEYAQ